MTQLFLNPLTKFTSDNITALPGARLYFYQNNSSTPKAVYADKAKVTSLGVYVEADSAGIFEPIWLDGTYRATLRYSANWTTDPVGVVQTGWPIDDVGDIGNFAAYAAWDSTFTYDITTNTFVTGPDGNYYKSIQNPNLNKNPISNPDYWEQIFVLSVWNATRTYAADDIVVWEGKMYSSIAGSNLNHEPPDVAYWTDLTFNNNIIGNLNVDGDIDVSGELSADTITATGVINSDSGFSGPGVVSVYTTRKTSDQTVTSSVAMVDATGMSMTLENGVVYHIRAYIRWNSGATTANGIRVSFSGASHGGMLWIANTNATSNNADPTANSALSPTFIKMPNASGGVDEVIIFESVVTGIGTTYKMQFAQAVSDATATTLKNQSMIIATKLA